MRHRSAIHFLLWNGDSIIKNSYGRGEEQLKWEGGGGGGGGEQQNFGGGVVRKTKKMEEEGNIWIAEVSKGEKEE